MTIIKIKDNFEIKGCDDCPFLNSYETFDEYGERTYELIFHCGLTDDDCEDLDDKNNPREDKPDNCPIISVTHEEGSN